MIQAFLLIIILFVIFFFIEIGWSLDTGWAFRATIITIGIIIGLVIIVVILSLTYSI